MAPLAQDRLVRKEVALGVVREIPPPQEHVGTRVLAPMLDVQSDDVIFEYVTPEVTGLAPARAEDAESELAQKDDTVGTGRASIIDWALKDHYDPSDVSRHREFLRLAELATGGGSFPLTIASMTEDFQAKVARDTARRRRKLDNRIEWMIWQAMEAGAIVYNDGKIKFTVDYGRPANQTDEAPPGGTWNLTTSDPINDALGMKEFMLDTYGINITRAIASQKVIRNILNSDKFTARSGLASGTNIDPMYLIDGWGVEAALNVFQRATGITITPYDAVYRTRAIGSTTVVNNRFFSDKKILFLPSESDIDELSDTQVGFGRTLTSPHPEGNWTTGYYEWERETVDPWGRDVGTGIKAFPVFPHLETTYTMTVLP